MCGSNPHPHIYIFVGGMHERKHPPIEAEKMVIMPQSGAGVKICRVTGIALIAKKNIVRKSTGTAPGIATDLKRQSNTIEITRRKSATKQRSRDCA